MQTKCPHCQTVFKVSDEHLKAADGYVRCGICKEVFNALEKVPQLDSKTEESPGADDDNNSTQADLFTPVAAEKIKAKAGAGKIIKPRQAEPKTVETKLAEDVPAKPVTTSPEIKSASKAVPKTPAAKPKEVAGGKTAGQIPAPTTPGSDSFKVREIPATAAEVSNNSLFDGVQSKLIPDEYRIPELHNTYSIWRDVTWTLAILILTASLFVEYAWFNRNELVSNPQLRPLISQICQFADCGKMNLREPNAIEMTTRNIYSHPNIKNALMISGALVNHAQFEQPYPNILIDFSDVRGEVIASRIFTPEDYLRIKASSLKPLAPQASIDFNMEILDPGKQAMTYEFSFL